MGLFKRSDLRRAVSAQRLSNSILESDYRRIAQAADHASLSQKFDVFLSHSFLDAAEVKVLASQIEQQGLTVYVDWIVDAQLDRTKVNRETAHLLRKRMANCKALFFATSQNSQGSRWMPWELGYFDALKGRVAIVPIAEEGEPSSDKYIGQEYLGLYSYIVPGRSDAGVDRLWVHSSEKEYINLKDWLAGHDPRLVAANLASL